MKKYSKVNAIGNNSFILNSEYFKEFEYISHTLKFCRKYNISPCSDRGYKS